MTLHISDILNISDLAAEICMVRMDARDIRAILCTNSRILAMVAAGLKGREMTSARAWCGVDATIISRIRGRAFVKEIVRVKHGGQTFEVEGNYNHIARTGSLVLWKICAAPDGLDVEAHVFCADNGRVNAYATICAIYPAGGDEHTYSYGCTSFVYRDDVDIYCAIDIAMNCSGWPMAVCAESCECDYVNDYCSCKDGGPITALVNARLPAARELCNVAASAELYDILRGLTYAGAIELAP